MATQKSPVNYNLPINVKLADNVHVFHDQETGFSIRGGEVKELTKMGTHTRLVLMAGGLQATDEKVFDKSAPVAAGKPAEKTPAGNVKKNGKTASEPKTDQTKDATDKGGDGASATPPESEKPKGEEDINDLLTSTT